MALTTEQREVLAHVVVDPDAWFSHAVATFGAEKAAEFLEAKVARWGPDYEVKKAAGGYKDRAARQAEEDAAAAAKLAAEVAALAEQQAARVADIALVLDVMPTRATKDALARLITGQSA